MALSPAATCILAKLSLKAGELGCAATTFFWISSALACSPFSDSSMAKVSKNAGWLGAVATARSAMDTASTRPSFPATHARLFNAKPFLG
ncbi:hypothetical protein D9M69_685190 [compost metagenome]